MGDLVILQHRGLRRRLWFQQNHEVVVSMYKDLADKTYVPNSTEGSWQDRLAEETELISTLLARFKDSESYLKTKANTPRPPL